MSIAKRVAKNTGFLLASEIIHKVLFFFLIIYATRILGAANFGRFSYAFALGAILLIFVNLGIPTYITRELSRDRSKEKYVGSLLLLNIILAVSTLIITGIILWITGYPRDYLIVIMIACISIFIDGIVCFIQSVFKAHEKMHYISLAKIIQVVVTFSIGLYILIWGNQTLIGFTGAFLMASIVAMIYTICILIRKFTTLHLHYDLQLWKSIIIKSLPFAISMIFGVIYFRTDTLMISWMQNDIATGIYNAAFQIIAALLFIPAIYLTAITPILSSYYKDNSERFRRLIRLSFKYIFILGLPIAIGISMLSQRITLSLYGSEFLSPALGILAWTGFLLFFGYLFSCILIAMDKEKKILKIQGYGALLNVILNIFLIYKFGFVGAAVATIITQAFTTSAFYRTIIKERYSMSILSGSIRSILACSLMALFLIRYNQLSLFITIPIGAAIYGIVFFILKGFNKEDIGLIKEIMFKNI